MSDWLKDIDNQDAREEALNEREKKFKKKVRKFKRDQLQKQIDDLKQEMKIDKLHYQILHDRTINDQTIERAMMKALAERLAFLYEVKTLIKDATMQALIERITFKFEMYQTLRLEEKRSLLEDVKQLVERMGLTTEKLEFRNEMNEKMHQINLDYRDKKLELMEKEQKFYETEFKTLSRNELILHDIKYLVQIHLMEVGHKMNQVQMLLQVDKMSRTSEGQKLLSDIEVKKLGMQNALEGMDREKSVRGMHYHYQLAQQHSDVSEQLAQAEEFPDDSYNIEHIKGVLRDIEKERDRFSEVLRDILSEK